MSDQENLEQNVAQPEEVEQENVSNEIIDVEWEELSEVFQIRAQLIEIDNRFSSLLLQYEKQKAAFLAKSQELELQMYEFGSRLRDQKGIDSQLTYELKLPSEPGKKGYFIRKDS